MRKGLTVQKGSVWLLPIVAWCLILPSLWARPQAAPAGIRMILVETEAEALEIRARIEAGASFELEARENSVDASAPGGGYLGRVAPDNLQTEFRNALADVGPGQVSPIARVGSAFVLLQVIPEEEQNWIELDTAAQRALQQGRFIEATALFREAIEDAETLGLEDYRLGESMNGLAAIYRLQEDWAEAAPLYRRSLEIRERLLGSEHVDVAASLNNLAEVERFLGNYREAEPLYRRSLSILEQALGPDHPNVARSLNNLAQLLEAQQDYAAAEPLSRRSLDIAERVLGQDHLEVAASLNNLAQILEAQRNYVEAAPLYRRSASILEQALGSGHPNLASSLGNLGRVVRAQGDHAEAVGLFRRSLSLRWGEGSADVSELLERFSALVRLAYFLDTEFEQAFREYEEALQETPVREGLYFAMSALLVEVAREEEAEAVMLVAVEAHPNSWRAQYELAEVFVESMKLQRALQEMERAVQMRANPAPDPRQRSFVYQRIGDIQSELLDFDAAEASYGMSLDIDPDRMESRMALGDLYLRNNRPEEALEQYNEVISFQPENAAAHTGSAEVNLRMRRYEESVLAAENALRIDPNGSAARYHRARALIQTGQRDEGQSELRAYQTVQAEEQAAEDRARDVYVLNRDAADKLVDGQSEEALRLFREGIESHPGEAAFHFNLAVAQSRLGEHEAAVQTLENMIDMEVGDDFLARRSLAGEYEMLGNLDASEQHLAAYLEQIEAALRSRGE